MNKKKERNVISLFEKQKQKIDDFTSNYDEFWRNETLSLVEKFIGKDSNQYGLLSNHTFWPNVNAIKPETEHSQKERGRNMIDLCISHIQAHGIKKEVQTPQTINNNYNNTIHSGDIYQSLSQDNNQSKQTISINSFNSNKQNTNTIIPKRENKFAGIIYWVVSVLAGIATIWLTLHELHIINF